MPPSEGISLELPRILSGEKSYDEARRAMTKTHEKTRFKTGPGFEERGVWRCLDDFHAKKILPFG